MEYGRCYDPEVALPADASKLQVVGYSLSALASLPRRLVNPPPKHPKLVLSDVLADRHCSPIALADFETYLVYTEHSVENLYFLLWLKAYTAEHATTDPARVAESVATAARTYIAPDAPYELNLTAEHRAQILAHPAAPPRAFDAAHREVQCFLEESLQRWQKHALANAGWRRLAFSTYVGAADACVTVVGMVVARVYRPGPTGRIVAGCLTPWLWFAIVGIVCGLKGVCFLCYSMGGTVRQVSSFELALPRRATMSDIALARLPPSASIASTTFPQDGESDKTGNGNDEPFSPHSARAKEFVVRDPPARGRGRGAVSKAMIVKLWAPMVKVEDPLVVRAHWEAVFYGFLWSMLVAVPVGVIAAAV